MNTQIAQNGITRRELLKYAVVCSGGIFFAPLAQLTNPKTALATTPTKIEPGNLVDGKYNWFLSFTNTEVENNGCANPLTFQNEIYTRDNFKAHNVYGHRYYSSSELSKIKGAAIRWTGGKYIDGTPVDLVATVFDYKPNWRASDGPGQEYNFFYCTTVGELNPYHEQLKPGINAGAPLLEFCGFTYIDLLFQFFKAGTTIPIKLAGHTSLSDVDWGEKFSFNGVDNIYISKANNFISINGDLVQAEVGERESLELTTASIFFDCEEFSLRYYGNPWQVGLCCFDSSSISTITPPDPEKFYVITE